jgi:DNA mismatch endonuclease (patch repair protein)
MYRVIRDNGNMQKLEYLGWNVLVLWECEIKKQDLLLEQLNSFLSS